MNAERQRQLKTAGVVVAGLLIVAWVAGWLDPTVEEPVVAPRLELTRGDDGNLTVADCLPATPPGELAWELRNGTGHIIDGGPVGNLLAEGNWSGIDVRAPQRGPAPPELVTHLAALTNLSYVDHDLNGLVNQGDYFLATPMTNHTLRLTHTPTGVVVAALALA